MRILIFGATGMVGQGVLRECLRDADVQSVRTVGRSITGIHHGKLDETAHPNLWNFDAIEGRLTGFDACFFCLGVSSGGVTEAEYERLTFGITMAAAAVLARLNPGLTFVYVSGAGTDTSERGRTHWARIKGRTENALLRMPFAGAYMFRPGIIEPLDGIVSRTKVYRVLYAVLRPLLPPLRRALPNYVLTTRDIGQAMLAVARRGWPKRVLEARDIRAVVVSANRAG